MAALATNLARPTTTHPTRYIAPGSKYGGPPKDLIVRREVDSGPPFRQAWAGPETPFSYPINWRLRFFSQALNFCRVWVYTGVPTDA